MKLKTIVAIIIIAAGIFRYFKFTESIGFSQTTKKVSENTLN